MEYHFSNIVKTADIIAKWKLNMPVIIRKGQKELEPKDLISE